MTVENKNFTPFAHLMRNEGLPDIVIQTFAHYYSQLAQGHTGLIPEADIQPVASLPDAGQFSAVMAQVGQNALPQTILLKLNGGLGTSMGLHKAKSLLEAEAGYTFLEVIAQQALRTNIPLVLMNSFATRDDSLAALKPYPKLWGDIPLDFVQHKILKITQADLSPAQWPQEPELAWCPPGHGDIYTALITSGMLTTLLDAGYQHVFVSNSDNLGAVIDPAILGYFVENKLPFMMEVANRTLADRKGGHLAQLDNGQLILRESAQCSPTDVETFQDITRHKYFNTNNLWLNLPALKQILDEKNNIMGLPMIRNKKTVDPRDSTSTPVYQLETAMGSAIAVFNGAGAVRVPRSRFAPVKTTTDLLAIRSDAFILTEDFHIIKNPARTLDQLIISLDPTYYKLIDDMEARFPDGTPSMLECQQLTIQGDIKFGKDVVLKGKIRLVNETTDQRIIEDGTVIEGE